MWNLAQIINLAIKKNKEKEYHFLFEVDPLP